MLDNGAGPPPESGSRKRPRPCNDDLCEFAPISKRMNNLHIRSGMLSTQDGTSDENCNELCPGNHNGVKCVAGAYATGLIPNASLSVMDSNLASVPLMDGAIAAAVATGSFVAMPLSQAVNGCSVQNVHSSYQVPSDAPDGYVYCPELTEGDNPHYYRINGLLYNLHIDRMQRLGRQPEL